ncbi:hypothetical protein PFISCL1PPCAC_21151, partial [Pristionchus fissidentatus]
YTPLKNGKYDYRKERTHLTVHTTTTMLRNLQLGNSRMLRLWQYESVYMDRVSASRSDDNREEA